MGWWLSDGAAVLGAWCAHPAATEKAVLNALAERTALLTDAVGGLSTLVTDRVLVREGQRVAAEHALLQKHSRKRLCQTRGVGRDAVWPTKNVQLAYIVKGDLLTKTSTNTSTASLSFGAPKSPR